MLIADQPPFFCYFCPMIHFPLGLKMTAMGKPTISKEFFELASLAISAMNGCETCVKSHEASVLHQGCTEARVYDAIRLSAVIRGFDAIVG